MLIQHYVSVIGGLTRTYMEQMDIKHERLDSPHSNAMNGIHRGAIPPGSPEHSRVHTDVTLLCRTISYKHMFVRVLSSGWC